MHRKWKQYIRISTLVTQQFTMMFELLILTEVFFIRARWDSDWLTGERAVPAFNDALFFFT